MWEILAAAAMVCFGTYYFLNKKKHRRIALACKAFATAMPGLLLIRYALRTGLIRFGTVSSGSAGAAGCQELSGISAAAFWFTLAAIVFYMAADVLLECRFVLGAVSFAAGHILMSAGILLGTADAGSFVEAGWVRFLCFALILFCVYAGAACFILRSFIPHLRAKKLFLPAAAYIAVLSMMAACAGAAGTSERRSLRSSSRTGRDQLCRVRCPAGTESPREEKKPRERRGGAGSVLSCGVPAGDQLFS